MLDIVRILEHLRTVDNSQQSPPLPFQKLRSYHRLRAYLAGYPHLLRSLITSLQPYPQASIT